MYNADLAFDKAPPLHAPMRFFVTAPLFGMAAALLLLWTGPETLASRWTPALLATTHLLTVGVLAMVMVGAVIQMVAVLAGSPIVCPRLLAGGVHVALVIGAAALGWGLFVGHRGWLVFAGVVLGLGGAGFVAVMAKTLLRAPRAHDSVLGIALAVVSFGVALGLGLVLASGHAFDGIALHRFPLTDVHAGWGVAGWVGLLVMGVAYQVVPLFQITPDYPERMRRWAIISVFAGLLMWSAGLVLAFWAAPAWLGLQRIGGVILLGAYGTFAVVTLYLQARRRRRLPDVTTDFWRVGMACALVSGLVWLTAQWVPALAEHRSYPLLLGGLLMGGFALSVINGMLYKIVPFLVWLHLQNQALSLDPVAASPVPNMKQIVRERWTRRQLRVHVAALALLLAALVFPAWLMRPAAAAFLVSFALLFGNLAGASRVYLRNRRRIIELARPAPVPHGARGV